MYLHQDLTEQVIKCYYKVYNTLGYGFLEKVYENAFSIEFVNSGFNIQRQKPINVFYEGLAVGDYFADIIVEDKVLIELKAVDILAPEHENQVVNYLKSTEIEVGLLLNFGKKAEIRRKIFTNDKKKIRNTHTDNADLTDGLG